MVSYTTIPLQIFRDRLRWYEQATAYLSDARRSPAPDHALLLSGLRKTDDVRWDIEIVHAVRIDPDDEEPFIEIWLDRPDGEGLERFWLDPEAAFALQVRLFYGNKFKVHQGKSSGKSRDFFWYLRPVLPAFEVDSNRLIVDCEPDRQAMLNEKEWRDLRRKGLGKTITDPAAAAAHGHRPRRSMMGRPEADRAAVKAWRRKQKGSGLKLPLGTYRKMLAASWTILDELRPLDPAKVKVKPRRVVRRRAPIRAPR